MQNAVQLLINQTMLLLSLNNKSDLHNPNRIKLQTVKLSNYQTIFKYLQNDLYTFPNQQRNIPTRIVN